MINFSTEQLKQVFNLKKEGPYIEYVAFTDKTIGFSVKREYPDSIRYYSPRTKNGKKDTVALIHIIYAYKRCQALLALLVENDVIR